VVSEPGLDPRVLRSSGVIARAALERLNLMPPLEKFHIADATLRASQEASSGGWCWTRIPRWPLTVVDVDINDAYPTIGALLGEWDHLAAAELVEEDVTEELRLLVVASPDELLNQLLDPRTWRHWGFTLVEVEPDGEPWPITVQRRLGDDPRLEVAPLYSPKRPFWFAWPDVANSLLLGGKMPRIRNAIRLRAIGHQAGLRPAQLRDVNLDPDENPIIRLVARRRQARREGQRRLVTALQPIDNSMAWGEWARVDPAWCSDGQRVTRTERLGPWWWGPVAATVPAGCRLVLGMLQRLAAQIDGHLAYWDTDGGSLVASRVGGEVELRNGRRIRALSWDEVDAILARFNSLVPLDDGLPFWKVRRGELHRPWWGVFVGAKRWVFFTRTPTGIHVEDASEHGLAGTYLAPRGHEDWFEEVADQVASALATGDARSPSWDAGAPALRRRSATRPEDLESLPAGFELPPFASYLEATSPIPGQTGPVAPDWGPDTDPIDLPWHDRDGRPVHVGTDLQDPTVTLVETLTTKAATWGGHELLTPAEAIVEPDPVHVHPALIRHVGRSGGKYRGDPDQLIYQDVEVARLLAEAAEVLGGRTVARLTGLPETRVATVRRGSRVRASTLERAIEGLSASFPDTDDPLAALAERTAEGRRCQTCRGRLTGRQRSWCSEACRKVAGRNRATT
jgi:hypothetical protein